MTQNVKRRGYTLLELQVAFIILSISVVGLAPLVVMQSRQLKVVEGRLDPSDTHYVTPSSNSWARKLGASATVSLTDPYVATTTPTLLLDDGDSGFSTQGSGWNSISGSTIYPPGATAKKSGGVTASQCYGGDCYHRAAGSGNRTATWQFDDLTPGWYDIRITWLPGYNLATNAPYTVFDGTDQLGTFEIDQTIAPSGPTSGGRPWQSLGKFSISGTTAKVRISNDADARVVADAVRLVPVSNDVSVLSTNKSMTSDSFTAHVSVTTQVP